MLSHHKNEHRWSINKVRYCIFGNQGIVRIPELITVLLTAYIGKITIYKRKVMNCKIINITNCETCKMRLLAVEYVIVISYYYQTANAKALCESIDEPAAHPTDNPPNWDRWGVFNRTVPKVIVSVDWQPDMPIRQRFCFDLDPDPKRPSGTIANSTHYPCPEIHHQLSTPGGPLLTGSDTHRPAIHLLMGFIACDQFQAAIHLRPESFSSCDRSPGAIDLLLYFISSHNPTLALIKLVPAISFHHVRDCVHIGSIL